ncbi:hypothetical protein [Candidatus Pyrohabitans sp.]
MEKNKVAVAILAGYVLLLSYAFAMGMMGTDAQEHTQENQMGLIDRLLGGFAGRGFGGYGMGMGMMGGHGMAGGYGGMMGTAMMGGGCGGFWSAPTTGEEITLEQAEQALTDYLSYIGDDNLGIREIMKFQYNYYAIIEEKDTGKGAFELLVDRRSGLVTPEPGPNMMWNLKYGHHGSGYAAENRITGEEAVDIAQRYIAAFAPGWRAEEHPDEFYGYYTLHTLNAEGRITGMLSVNGFTGAVWFHSWHGTYEGNGHEE